MSSEKSTRRRLRDPRTRTRIVTGAAAYLICAPLGFLVWHLMKLDDGIGWLFLALALVGVLRFLLWFLLPVAKDASNLDDHNGEPGPQ